MTGQPAESGLAKLLPIVECSLSQHTTDGLIIGRPMVYEVGPTDLVLLADPAEGEGFLGRVQAVTYDNGQWGVAVEPLSLDYRRTT